MTVKITQLVKKKKMKFYSGIIETNYDINYVFGILKMP